MHHDRDFLLQPRDSGFVGILCHHFHPTNSCSLWGESEWEENQFYSLIMPIMRRDRNLNRETFSSRNHVCMFTGQQDNDDPLDHHSHPDDHRRCHLWPGPVRGICKLLFLSLIPFLFVSCRREHVTIMTHKSHQPLKWKHVIRSFQLIISRSRSSSWESHELC